MGVDEEVEVAGARRCFLLLLDFVAVEVCFAGEGMAVVIFATPVDAIGEPVMDVVV